MYKISSLYIVLELLNYIRCMQVLPKEVKNNITQYEGLFSLQNFSVLNNSRIKPTHMNNPPQFFD